MHRIAWALPAVAMLLGACSAGSSSPQLQPSSSTPSSSASAPFASAPAPVPSAPASSASAAHRSQSAAGRSQSAAGFSQSAAGFSQSAPAAAAALAAALPASGGPARLPPSAQGVLHGKVVVIDPGHNGGNAAAAAIINQLIWNGRETETCDTTGTQTDSGYTEALFNWNVALYLAADLRAEGATVVLTRTTNTGVGPCVTRRAAIGNQAHANAAVSIHADGGPPYGRGFAILEPVADGINNAIIGRSATLGADLRAAFAAGTGEPVSSYDGIDGIQPRNDLAGTNLSTIPKVFIECANMRNAADARLVTSPRWQAKAARAIAAGLTAFLRNAR